jgi:endonuclease/exonuclease/phosphatase (EEP) superfamily protein YafD
MKSHIYLLLGVCLIFILQVGDVFGKKYTIPPESEVINSFGRRLRFKKSLNPNHINVLVWNLYKGEKDDWKTDFLALSKNKDLLILQELYMDQKMKSTFKLKRKHLFKLATSFIYKEENIPTGVGIGSVVSPVKVNFQRSTPREPVIKTPKLILFHTYKIRRTRKKLLVANIHGINFVKAKALKDQLLAAQKYIQEHKGPVIFAGDFNTWSEKKQKIMYTIMNELNLSEVTFKNDQRTTVFGNVIDFIFYRGLKLKESKTWGELEGSDHVAMSAQFEYKN